MWRREFERSDSRILSWKNEHAAGQCEIMSIDRGGGGSGGRMASRLRLAPGGGEIKKSPPVPRRSKTCGPSIMGELLPGYLPLVASYLPATNLEQWVEG